MKVSVFFFASLVDVVGSRQLSMEVSEGGTVSDLLGELESSHPGMKAYRPVLLTAVNEEYVQASHAIVEGDEVAIFPPVSGGQPTELGTPASPHGLYRITHESIDAQQISRELLRDEVGAICVFEGVVRNNSNGKSTEYLIYEAYETMALKKLEELGESVRQLWEIDSIAIIHRLGRMEIGETSVAIVVTSAHRRAAFDSCHYAIDRLKKIVPIWKKEFFDDGEIWVEGQS
jgi:molybdopterin converting factor subunit 1